MKVNRSEEIEQHRLQCEARTVLSWPKPNRTQYLELVTKKRGEAACAELKKEIMRQWREQNK